MTENLKTRDVVLIFISLSLMLSLAIGGLGIISRDDAYSLPGDSFEYLMIPVSVMNHGSSNVTSQDIEDAKAYYGNSIFDNIFRDRADITLTEGSNGNLYVRHYGLYSVLCMPLRALFHMAGVNPAKAFMVMNLLFWLASCLAVQFILNADQLKKTLLMIFLVLNPAWFYLTWVHTEVLMLSCVVISLVLRHNGKYTVSMFFMSLGAMNNLTLLVPAFFLGIEFLIHEYREFRDFRNVAVRTIPVLLFALPGFIPVIRSFILFGSYSPVAAVASVSLSDNPVDNGILRAFSYIVDPNQGMTAYTLLIAPVFFILCIVNLIRKGRRVETVIALSSAVLMLFVVSRELHINCGMAYIMRYNIWMLPFYAFYIVFNIRRVWLSSSVFSVSGIWTLFVVVYLSFTGPSNLYLGFTPLGKFAVERLPDIYNPPVGIFYSRTLSSETYYSGNPVGYHDGGGNLRKILITEEAAEGLDAGEWDIYDPEFHIVDYRQLDPSGIAGGGFTYININEDGYHLIDNSGRLDFSDVRDVDNAVIVTSVGYENNQALVYGNDLELDFHMLPGAYTGIFDIANVFGGVQFVEVSVNGDAVYEGDVSMDDDSFTFDFEVGEDCICNINVHIPGALSPMSVNPQSSDDRVLSLYLKSFEYMREES